MIGLRAAARMVAFGSVCAAWMVTFGSGWAAAPAYAADTPAPSSAPGRFAPADIPWSAPLAPSAELAAVAADTLRARTQMGAEPGATALPEGLPGALAGEAAATLAFVTRVAAEDSASGADRLADPAFLGRCFQAFRWAPDSTRWGDQIRLTRYLVYSVEGRATPDAAHAHALWALPEDERGLSTAEADTRRASLDRFRYTRQDVARGVYNPGGAAAGHATALVWLTHADHEEALLQGTIAVSVPGEAAPRLYNVHRNNGIAYDRALSDTRAQRRYWYFRARDAARGWAAEPIDGPALRPMVAVAGNLPELGFGRLLAIQAKDGLRLVVLADTGGAFDHNLHQLDLYAGVYPTRAALDAATASVGDTAAAWVLRARVDEPACR